MRYLTSVLFFMGIIAVGESDRQVHCPTYHGSRTNNGLDHYCLCSFRFCRDEVANIDSCENSVGHPVLYLVDMDGNIVNSTFQFINYPCASLVNIHAPTMTTKCEIFQVQQGCQGQRSCQGSARIDIRSNPSSELLTSKNRRQQLSSVNASRGKILGPIGGVATAKSGQDSTFGYCTLGPQYNLVETLLIAIACLFAFAICCCGIAPLVCAIIKSFVRPNANNQTYAIYRQRFPFTPPVTELTDDDDIKCEHP